MFGYYIIQLSIVHFRCIEDVKMTTIFGANFLYGGNDSGKTTILEALGLAALLDNSIRLLDSDFFEKNVEKEILIDLTFACNPIHGDSPLRESELLNSGVGNNHGLVGSSESVKNDNKQFKLRVRGTGKLELKYTVSKIIGMNVAEVEEVLNSFAGTRIIGNAKSNDHLFQKSNMKSRVVLEYITTNQEGYKEYAVKQHERVPLVHQAVPVIDLNSTLREINLPLISDSTVSEVVDGKSMEKLIVSGGRTDLEFPLGYLGAGIQEIVPQLYEKSRQGTNLIQLVDDAEGKLDTTKQQNYLEHMCHSGSQIFASIQHFNLNDVPQPSAVWVNSPPGNIFQPTGDKLKRLQQEHPSIFKHKLIIIAEGKTEVGYITTILTLALGRHPKFFGIIVVEGHGNAATYATLEECLDVRLKMGALVDREPADKEELWDELKQEMGPLLCQWREGYIEKNVIPAILRVLPIGRVHEFISHLNSEITDARLDSLASRLNVSFNLKATPKEAVEQIWVGILKKKDIKKQVGKAREQAAYSLFVNTIIEVAIGRVPKDAESNQRHKFESMGRVWFKSIEGGEELAEKMLLFGAWKPAIEEQVMRSVKAYLEAVGVTPKENLPEFNPADAKWCVHVNVR